METAELRARIDGQIESNQAATLFPLSLDGYWADKHGNEVSETFFGDEIRYYLKHFPKYQTTLNITISIPTGYTLSQEEQLLKNSICIQPINDEAICVVQINIKDRWELNSCLKNTKVAILKLHIGTFMYGVSEHIDSIEIREFKVENNFIVAGPKVKSTAALVQATFSQNVHAIVLHRTGSSNVSSPLNSASSSAAAHLYVDKNGDVYHKINLVQKAPHIGSIRVRPIKGKGASASSKATHNSETTKNYPERYPYNEDSIGIEVVGMYLTRTNPTSNQTPYYYIAPTDIEQIKSIARIVNFLTGVFSLNKDEDIYGHEVISSKSDGEGETIHDVIKPYLL